MQELLSTFSLTRFPELKFGAGIFATFRQSLPDDPSEVLWITGGKAGQYSCYFKKFLALADVDIFPNRIIQIQGEPSPEQIDSVCDEFNNEKITLVVGVGGGSVIDAAKAIAAIMPSATTVLDHLEGVGRGIPHSGERLAFIAVPTTSGTGSETTANAVLSEVGESGYKKSLRHKNFVPDAVWIEPALMTSCPPLQTAACGMDAFTQLLEPYLSTNANPITDALAEKGLQLIIENLELAVGEGAEDIQVRGNMALASLLSGTCLANAGLGIVHGLAGPIGGFIDIPHGIVCAGLVAKANELTLDAMLERSPENLGIKKMAKIGRFFKSGHKSDEYYCRQLIENLYRWEQQFNIPKFSEFGMQEVVVEKVLASANNRNNPVELNKSEIEDLLRYCL